MIKKYLLLSFVTVVVFVSSKLGQAQSVTDYVLTPSSGTFTSIQGAGGTVDILVGGSPVGTWDGFGTDSNYLNDLPIGFTFSYLGQNYDAFAVSTNGFMSLGSGGTTSLTSSLTTNDLDFGGGTGRPILAPLWDDLDMGIATSYIGYEVTGSAGSQVLTVEWTDVEWNWLASSAVVSFQVKIYEDNGNIEFIYQDAGNAVNSPSASIGITDVNTGVNNFASLSDAGTSPTLSYSVETTSISAKPADGQTYTFSIPPVPSLSVSEGTNIANGGTVDFGLVITGTPDVKTFTLSNGGTGALDIDAIDLTMGSATEYSITDSPMLPLTLNFGESATFEVTFSPTSEGSFTGQVEIGSNDPDDDPYVINLTGSSGVEIFSEDFDGETGPGLPTGWSERIEIGAVNSWTLGTAAALDNESVYISSDGGVTNSYDNGATTAVTLISPAINTAIYENIIVSFDFLVDGENGFDEGSFYYSTDGGNTFLDIAPFSNPYVVGAYNGNDGDIFQDITTSTPVSIALPSNANNLLDLRIAFRWDNDGSFGNAPSFSIDNIVVVGQTVTPPAGVSLEVRESGIAITNGVTSDFGTVEVSESSSRTFTLTNTGGDPLTISASGLNITSGGTDYSITDSPILPLTLNFGDFATFEVTFSPTADGTRTGVVEISSNDPDDNPFVINLTGSGFNVIYSENFDGETGLPTGWTTSDEVTDGTNVWSVGSGVGVLDNESMYVSNDGGVTNSYDNSVTTAITTISESFSTTGFKDLVASFDFISNGESGWDYGSFYVSTDGTTFTEIAPYSDPYTVGAYNGNTTSFFDVTTSRTSVSINLPPSFDNQSTVFLAFRWDNDDLFGSGESFAIDNIVVTGVNIPPNDVAVTTIIDPANSGLGRENTCSENGTAVNISVEITNFGLDTQTSIPVSYSIDAGTAVTETWTGSLAFGETTTYTFTTAEDFSSTKSIEACTALAMDADNSNDCLTDSRGGSNIANAPIMITGDNPYFEGFESTDITDEYTGSTDLVLGLNGAEAWDFQSAGAEGRLRMQVDTEPAKTGDKAATMDRVGFGAAVANDLILTLNMSNYNVTDNTFFLGFSFRAAALGEESHDNDRVWIRGSCESDWVEIYNLNDNSISGVYVDVEDINISQALSDAGQEYSSSFQVRFGQEDTAPTNSDGLTFDDISIYLPKPTATLTDAPDVTTAGGTTYQFEITYEALFGADMDVSTLDNNDVLVEGPDSFSQLATFVSASPNSDDPTIVATYQITPPGGDWDVFDSGTYSVSIVADEVNDSNVASVDEGTIGDFEVDICPDITLDLSAGIEEDCESVETNITITNSQTGIDYQLRDDADDSNVGSIVVGTGGDIMLPTGVLTSTTTFNVLASSPNCDIEITETVTVTVNELPTITGITDPQSINEDTPTTFNFTIGDAETDADNLGITVESSNTSLVENASLVIAGTGTDRTLEVTPIADENNDTAGGSTTITLTVSDEFGCESELVFELNVNPVNDAPSFTASDPAAILEDAGAQSIPNWATFTAGPANESGQSVLAYTVENISDASFFAVEPSVSNTGELTYTVADDANGTVTFEVNVQDDGGTDNGGIDVSANESFTITVTPVNDAPSLAAGDVTVNEDAGAQNISNWATFTAGPTNESGQSVVTYTVSNISNTSLFTTQPSVDVNGNLIFEVAAETSGSSTFDITVQDDGGTTDGGIDVSSVETFTITVNSVNDMPSLTANDVTVNEDAGAQNISNWATFDAGATNESGQSVVAYTINNISNTGLFSTQPSVDINGNLTFETATNAFGSSTFDITVQDDGGTDNGGVDRSEVQTFTITVNPINDTPTIVLNEGLLDAFRTSYGIDNTMLQSSDVDDDDASLIYTVKAVPSSGNLQLSGTTLNVDDTFTQTDIDNNSITFVPTNINVNFTDSFNFTVQDDEGAETTEETFDITIDVTSSVEEDVWKRGVIVFPNPSQDGIFKLGIEVPYTGKVELVVYDSRGSVIINEVVNKDKLRILHTLSLEGKATGTYFLKIGNKETQISKKLVIR